MSRPTRTVHLSLLLAALVMAFTLALGSGCGKPTVEGQKSRYDRAKDSLDVLKTKMPSMKASIETKLVEFDKQFKEAEAKGGEAAIKAMGSVVRRMEDFEKKLNPQKTTGTATPAAKPAGSKLKDPAAKPAAAPGGKLGQPAAPAAKPAGGKLGGAPAPAAKPAPTPTPAAKPAPAPAQPASGGSGFGGK